MPRSVYINRVSACLPHAPVDNDTMEARLGQVGERPSRARSIVLRRNGIRQRHYAIDAATGAPTLTNAELAAAAIRALTDSDHPLAAIDCLVAGTSAPDQLMPGHGVMVHGELGNPSCEVVTTAGICLCGVTALKYAWLSVSSGDSANAVAAGSEVASNLMQARNFSAELESAAAALERRPELAFDKDFLRWMLSDGAGAVWLSDRPSRDGLSLRIDWIDVVSFADQLPPCMYAGADYVDGRFTGWSRMTAEERNRRSVMAIKQDVKLLDENIVEFTVVRALERILPRRQLTADAIDWLLPHYSSEFFRDRLAEGLARVGLPIPQERWFTNLTSRGNTGSASFFIMLEELFHSGRLRPGQRLLGYVPESGRFSSAFLQFTVVDADAV